MKWLIDNSGWIGYAVMGLLGGAVSHILYFEKLPTQLRLRDHARMLCSCWCKAAFVCLIVFYMQQAFSWGGPLSFIAAGMCSVFASDAIRSFYPKVLKMMGVEA